MPASFDDFQFRDEISQALREASYDVPTPIQERAIPILMQGHDLIGVAETGTGKTLAFLLPMFQRFRSGESDAQGLVICPTRELAIQVAGEAERFGQHLGVRVVLAYGGTSSGEQKRLLADGVDLVVGTPGRLLDFVNSAWLSLRNISSVVLDEADRMLDMGFITDVDAILRRSPMSRQTMLFSATIPDEIRRLADRYMLHPEMVKMHTGTRVTASVDHAFYPVRERQKEQLIGEILARENPGKALVFTATREGTSALALALRRRRWEVVSLSSLLSQANRERALTAFRKGEFNVLVATDVAARGLDVTDIDLVVNFDLPMQPEDYVHRIGRTGRAERSGKAVTLVSEFDHRRVRDIERLLGEPVERVTLDGFEYEPIPEATSSRSGRPSSGRDGRRPAGRGGSGGRGTAGGREGRGRRPGRGKPAGRGRAGGSSGGKGGA
jgi:superfamily II DNA/RNA helicase